MANLSKHQARLLKIANKVLTAERVAPGGIGSEPEFTDFGDLRAYLELAQIQAFISDAEDLTHEALQDVSQALAETHAAAAAISVEGPTDAQVEEFKEKLEALHEDIKNDQRFSAALKLVDGLVSAIDTQLNS